eukprot:scaffold177628_cov30-Tisochrysis_lutea.AAC.1
MATAAMEARWEEVERRARWAEDETAALGARAKETGVGKMVVASVYLNAQPNKRKEEIKLIHASTDITSRTILAGDFNCVENVSRNTKSKQGAGPYSNSSEADPSLERWPCT